MAVGVHVHSLSAETDSTTSCTIAISGSAVSGELFLLATFNRDSTTQPTITQTGAQDDGGGAWTSIKSQNDGISNLSLFYKTATSTSRGKVVTVSGCTGSCAAVMIGLSGDSKASTWYANLSGENNVWSGLAHTTVFVPTKNGSLAVLVIGLSNDYDISNQTSNVGVMIDQAARKSTGGSDCSIDISTRELTTAGDDQDPWTWAHSKNADLSIVVEILPLNTPLDCPKGVFTVTRNDATLRAARKLTGDAGSFAVTGNTANLLAHRVLSAASGSFTSTGHDANLLAHRILAVESGEYVLAGNDAALLAHRVLSAEPGIFEMVGNDAELTYIPSAGHDDLVGEPGVYTMTGNDANLIVHRLLTADPGVFVTAGNDADLTVVTPEVVPEQHVGGGGGGYSNVHAQIEAERREVTRLDDEEVLAVVQAFIKAVA